MLYRHIPSPRPSIILDHRQHLKQFLNLQMSCAQYHSLFELILHIDAYVGQALLKSNRFGDYKGSDRHLDRIVNNQRWNQILEDQPWFFLVEYECCKLVQLYVDNRSTCWKKL